MTLKKTQYIMEWPVRANGPMRVKDLIEFIDSLPPGLEEQAVKIEENSMNFVKVITVYAPAEQI